MTLLDALPTAAPTLELPVRFFARAAQAMVAALPRTAEKGREHLHAARYTGEVLIASDGYRAALVEIPRAGMQLIDRYEVSDDLVIPYRALLWISRVTLNPNQRRAGIPQMTDGGYSVRLTVSLALVVAALVGPDGENVDEQEFPPASDVTYPPVEKLFDRWEEGEPHLPVFDGAHLGPIAQYAAKHPRGDQRLTIRPGKPLVRTGRSTVPGAARIDTADATFLIMPVKER
ncbi:hypothetical protein [Microbacterium sp. 77mftsu3.1]|uniref:hypothetical protein n=1 Tax=Microbacterium sp. 77mftsu3.1 TaxID=1761802 RepID=UPI000380F077|nr:hypothetical protein [Microbacterium sp. 77mftsu3.1]SDH40018.1 hypothetical protein SAMN04488590_3242 [Microbacterium sp. 77mftsu3.1]